MTVLPTRVLSERNILTLTAKPHLIATWYSDRELRGFAVRVFPDGRRVFFIRYSVRGVRKTITIGRYGTLTVAQARAKAKQLLAEVELGGDPAAEAERQKKIPTWPEWVKLYLARIAGRRKRTRDDVRYLAVCSGRWSDRPLDTITREDVEALYQHVKASGTLPDEERTDPPPEEGYPTTANRWMQAVRPCFEEAYRSGLIPGNPARGLKRFLEAPPRARVLSDDEMGRLVDAVMADQDLYGRAALRLLIETGARLSEVLRARWEDFDLEAGTWRIPSPKAGHPQVVPIARTTVAALKRLPHAADYVIAGRDPEKPRSDLKGPWERVTTAAGLKDVHVHDIRRTYGLAVAKSAGLHVASKLLRHADVRITERVYAPLGLEDLRAAVEKRTKTLPFPRKTMSGD